MFRKWKKGTHLDPQREKLKQELYSFKKTVEHGFPHHPSAFAYDPILKLMAIGTKSGAVKIYGAPGVEFTGMHPDVNQVLQLHFLNGEGRIISILDDNTMHLWELKTIKGDNAGSAQALMEVEASQLAGRPGQNQITSVVVRSDNSALWVGTEGGSIFSLSLPKFEPLDASTIHQDQVMQSVPEHYKSGKALGPVESISEHPKDPTKILIGYNRGLVALWNDQTKTVEQYYLGDKTLESLCWNSNCEEFVSTHNDGYLCTWRLDSSSAYTTYAPYGPFPCKAISKAQWKSSRTHPYLIFGGGMPRANYGDRHCVSVVHGSKHIAFDFTSRIIDFFVICKNGPNADWEDPEFLMVLAEEELVAIDLVQEDWPCMTPPYLASPHASAITCSYHVNDVDQQLFDKIKSAAQQKTQNRSTASWPITGGTDLSSSKSKETHDILLTGHEDGSVKLWEVSGVAMCPLVKLQTSTVFITDSDAENDEAFEEQFPPFRKVGEFDPYSDDLRLSVRKISMCPVTGTIVAGGTAGQVVVLVLAEDSIESLIVNNSVDVLEGRTDFTWKGHEQLDVKTSHITMQPGYQVSNVVQCQPPASITSLSVHANWGLVGFGTSHGFVLFDYLQNQSVLARCTLEAGDHLAMEGTFSRMKSFKMSLRQSMRRIRGSFRAGGGSRRRQSGKRRNYKRNMSEKLQEANAALVDEEETASNGGWSPSGGGHRRIEARSSDDGMTGIVRCTYFATTYIRDSASSSPTFWAGTNSGSVFVYAIHVPDYSQRQDHHVTVTVGKHIQLMHRAPVVDITVVDGYGCPVNARGGAGGSSSKNGTKSSPTSSSHHLILGSEEQIKVFALPRIAPKRKFKMTAVDGSLLRKVIFSKFPSAANPEYHEYGMGLLTNLGEIHIFSQLPALRPQVTFQCMARDDAHAIASTVFTGDSQGFYLLSPSEYERFTMSAATSIAPSCCIEDNVTTAARGGERDIDEELSHSDVQVTVEDSEEFQSGMKTPSRHHREGSIVVATPLSSPKTPLLCDNDDDDEDDDDDDHLLKHQSLIIEAERAMLNSTNDDDQEEEEDGSGDAPDATATEFNIEDILGAVADAEAALESSA